MEIRKLDQAGRDFLAKEEGGYQIKPYLCPAKIPTISAGATYYENGNKVKLSDPMITMERAKAIFANILPIYEQAVYSITRDDINQNQFNALVSLAYNIGCAAFKKSTVVKRVNANPNDPTIRNAFAMWNKANGKELKGLTLRRGREANLYFS